MTPKPFALSTLILLVASLGGCATGGTTPLDARAEALAPAKPGYPAVEDVPARRGPPLTDAEQLKLQKELSALRDRQMGTAKIKQN